MSPTPDPLAAIRDGARRAAVLTDFDGTLAPIVDDPAQSRPLVGAREALAALAATYGRAGVVSGRPAAFLLQHLGAPRVWLSGLYGLEWVVDGAVMCHPEAEGWRATVADAVATAVAHGPEGMRIEDKGLSVTFHYREHADAQSAVLSWGTAEASRTGLAAHIARMSIELRPPVARDKGTAVTEAVGELDAVCFIGDDRGDLPAFDALDRLAAERGCLALRVVVRNAEAPAELIERADVILDGPEATLELLARLLPR